MSTNSPRRIFDQSEVGLPVLLFAFLGSAVAWSLHFGIVYFLDALLCTTGRGDAVRAWVLATTAVFLLVSVAAGVVAYLRWRALEEPHASLGDATVRAAGRTRILLVMGVMGSVLFTLFILLEGLTPLLVEPCAPISP